MVKDRAHLQVGDLLLVLAQSPIDYYAVAFCHYFVGPAWMIYMNLSKYIQARIRLESDLFG